MERRKRRKRHGNSHISLAAIKQYLLYGSYPNGSTPSDKRSVRKRAETFKIEDEELFYVVRPKRLDDEPPEPNPGANKANLRKALLTARKQLAVASQIHVSAGGTHMGTERTLHALTSKYYWVGMAATVKKVIKNCAVCLANRPASSTAQPSPQFLSSSIGNVPIGKMDSTVSVISAAPEVDQKEPLDKLRSDLGSEDAPFVVTAEITEPEQVDSDLDFDASYNVAEDIFEQPTDIVAAQRFWERVELLILGPFTGRKRKQIYIAVAMDSYSKWPEIQTLEKVNERTISHFCVKLIARFGAMEQLILLENDVSRQMLIDAGGVFQNLQMFQTCVSKENQNAFDESWNRLVKGVNRFITHYSEMWFQCLELAVMPLRSSLIPSSDFSPAYLVTGREPAFPKAVYPHKHSLETEVVLSKEQMDAATDCMMTQYVGCSVPDIKTVMTPVTSVREETSNIRRSGRKMKKYSLGSWRRRSIGESDCDDSDEDFPVPSSLSASSAMPAQPARRGRPPGSHKDSQRKTEGISAKFGTAQSIKYPVTVDKNNDKNVKAATVDGLNKNSNEMGELDTDTYHQVLQLYIYKGDYPANSSDSFKREVERVAQDYCLENGVLMYREKDKLRPVVMTTEERLVVLDQLHVRDGEHLSKAKVLEGIEEKRPYWKGMSLDIEAYIRACPFCRCGLQRKKKSHQVQRWYRARIDEEGDDSSDETSIIGAQGKVSYRDLVDYLRKSIAPDDLSRSEMLGFKKKSRNFKMLKGVLYYVPVGESKAVPRKVLMSEKEQQEALKKAYGENKDSGAASILTSLKKWSFWSGMASDVDQFVASENQLEASCEDKQEERKQTELEERVVCFQSHFDGKNIYKKVALDTLFRKKASEKISNEKKDLVAAAMESANLPSEDSGLTLNEISGEFQDLSTKMATVTTRETAVIRLPEEESRVLDSQDPQNQEIVNNTTSTEQNLKMEITEQSSLQSTVKQEKESTEKDEEEDDDERMEENMDGDYDEDEDWDPNKGKGKRRAPQVKMSPVVKKRSFKQRCEVCQEIIRGENSFKEHMYKHTGVKPFNCKLCHKMFTSVKGLKMHMRRHTGHRPFLCSICGRGFPRSASLRYHIKTHDKGGGMPVICEICNRVFTTQHRLDKHKRFKHPVQAPVFMCEQCGKQFTAKRSLKRHEMAHKGIRNFKCKYCQRSFFRKEYLNYHLVSHSNEDPSLANYKIKHKLKKHLESQQKPNQQALSIVSVEPAGLEVGQDGQVYRQLVEVADPREWTEVQQTMETSRTIPTVLDIDGSVRVGDAGDQSGEITTVVMLEGQANGEVQHIIMSGSHLQDQTQSAQHQIQHQGGNFEVTLSSQDQLQQLQVGELGQETVQYQVECLPGESLSEDDYNAIRLLAQASLSGAHIVQQ